MAISRLLPLYQNLTNGSCTMCASTFSDLATPGAPWLRLSSACARFGSDLAPLGSTRKTIQNDTQKHNTLHWDRNSFSAIK